ncbi:maltokinase N-terminal cap-like domain-containing protein [Streptomyces sp. RGM 3693]|uniref:maltokinase N-terminal cap-like domain-containing protein n=1 Tax=Streptomyces sp. RGM 3693 TaxID=3413284 RepID=UPI003D2E9CB7
MAVIHNTSLKPTKLEVLTAWLPSQPWYQGSPQAPQLARSGGFRIDDPQGEVGIECMVVTDRSGDVPRSYFIPLTYRGAPLDGAEQALVGTTEHGILGRRWIYDGTHDPVLAAQLLALLQGRAEPQAQNASNVRDESVTRHVGAGAGAGFGSSRVLGAAGVANGPHGTDLTLETTTELEEEPEAEPDDHRSGPARTTVILHIARVLEPVAEAGSAAQAADAPGRLASVAGVWQSGDGTEQRGLFVALRSSDR